MTTYRLLDNSNIDSEHRLILNTVCNRPELRPLLSGMTFSIDNEMSGLFYLEESGSIRIGSQLLSRPVLAAFHLRHALELSLLTSRLFFDNHAEAFTVTAIAALHTSMRYLNDMIAQEKEEVLQALPDWMHDVGKALFALDHSAGYADEAIQAISPHIGSLFTFQSKLYPNLDVKQLNDSFLSGCRERIRGLLAVSIPTERILTQCGDTRLTVDKVIGLNRYGCSPRPRPWAITFSSCTSSSVSDYSFWSAEELRQSLFADAMNGCLSSRYELELERVRSKLADVLQLGRIQGTELVLTSSGTDAEFYALHLAIGDSNKPLRNILISKTEVGSGTAFAAGGRHFDCLTPLGKDVVIGDPVEGFPVESIEVTVLDLRGDYGSLPLADELDSQIRAQVEEAISTNKRVLIHLLDCSKTGIGGPSLNVIQELKLAYHDRVEVLVDAAQFRLGRVALRRYLESGFMVLMTGSKFFTGPPFSGALIVPPEISLRVPNIPALPEGMNVYATRAELPAIWRSFGKKLSNRQNLGLLLRWQSALWEINAFYSVTRQEQFRIIQTFGQKILDMIENNSDLQLVMAPPHDRGYRKSEQSWDQLPTIFTFMVQRIDSTSNEQRPLTYDEARYAYQCINMDITRFLPPHASDRDRELAAKRCHIGQPVNMHKDNDVSIGALRIAAGARLVSGVQFDNSLGDRPDSRLDREIQTAGVVFNKLSVIVKYWDDLKKYDLISGANTTAGFYQF